MTAAELVERLRNYGCNDRERGTQHYKLMLDAAALITEQAQHIWIGNSEIRRLTERAERAEAACTQIGIADIIKRYQAELAGCRKELDFAVMAKDPNRVWYEAACDYRAENKRLREALRIIHMNEEATPAWQLRVIARAALGEKE